MSDTLHKRSTSRLGTVAVLWTGLVLLQVSFPLGGLAGPLPGFPSHGDVGGDPLQANLDSEAARYFLEAYLPGKRIQGALDVQVQDALASLSRGGLTDDSLRSVAEKSSVDLAALLFAHLTSQQHWPLKRAYLKAYEAVKTGRLHLGEAPEKYKILLIPGLFYSSKPETKGDLREVKEVLESQGFQVERIPILEAGTVEQNGRIISDFIKNEPKGPKRLILVSTSKGGPDTLAALGLYLDPKSAGTSSGGVLPACGDGWQRC